MFRFFVRCRNDTLEMASSFILFFFEHVAQCATELIKSVFNSWFNIWTSLCLFGVDYVKVFRIQYASNDFVVSSFFNPNFYSLPAQHANAPSSNEIHIHIYCLRSNRTINSKSCNKKWMVRLSCVFSLLDKGFQIFDSFLFSPSVYGTYWERLNKKGFFWRVFPLKTPKNSMTF